MIPVYQVWYIFAMASFPHLRRRDDLVSVNEFQSLWAYLLTLEHSTRVGPDPDLIAENATLLVHIDSDYKM